MARNEKERFATGTKHLISCKVASATVIDKGDFVCIINGAAIPASDIADAGDAAANREAAADAFCGICETATVNGSTTEIQVDLSTHATFDLTLEAAAAASIGDLMEIYADTSAPSRNTMVAGGTSPVAVVVRDQSSQVGQRCQLLPSKLFGTAQA